MAENVQFELELLAEKVVGPAKWAAKAIEDIEKQAAKAQKALSFSGELHKSETAIKKLAADPAGFVKMVRAQKELAEQRNKLKAQANVGSFGEGLKEKLSFTHLTKAAAVGEIIGEGVLKAGEFLVDKAKEFVEIFTEGFKDAVKAGAQEEQLRLGFGLSLGAQKGGEALGNIKGFAERTGHDDTTIGKLSLPLLRAGLDAKTTRSAFAASADIAAGEGQGGNAGRIGELMELFKKIKLKGGVSDKMLISLGVETKEFYADLGKQLGISAKAAKEKATKGNIDPQRLLNTVWSGIEKRQGGQLGTGSEKYGKTMEARLAKLKRLPEEYFKTIVDSPGFQKLSDAFGAVLEKLSPESPTGQKIIAKLSEMFDKIVGWFDELTTEAGMDSIAKGVETVIEGFKGFVDVLTQVVSFLKQAVDLASRISAVTTTPLIKMAMRAAGGDSEEETQKKEFFRKFVKERIAAAKESSTEETPGPWSEEAPRRPKGVGSNSVLAPVTMHIVAAPGEDPTHTGQKVKEAFDKHANNALEQAANQAGAGNR